MKVNQRLIIIICIAVFVIALAFMYLQYQKQVTARTTAQSNLSSAQTNLTKMTADKTKAQKSLDAVNSQLADLQIQLTQAVQNLSSEQTFLPQSVDNINYNETLFRIAHDCNVVINSLTSNPPAASTVNQISLTDNSFAISLTGTGPNVQLFIHTLTTDTAFVNASIDSINTTLVQQVTPQGTTEFTQANISLSLYSYK